MGVGAQRPEERYTRHVRPNRFQSQPLKRRYDQETRIVS